MLFFPPMSLPTDSGGYAALRERYTFAYGTACFAFMGDDAPVEFAACVALGASPCDADGVSSWWWTDGMARAYPGAATLVPPRRHTDAVDPVADQWCPELWRARPVTERYALQEGWA